MSATERYELYKKMAEQNEALHAENERLRQALGRWKRAVEGLTPGGSEFVDDPERCAKFIKDRTNYPKRIIRLQAELAAALAAQADA